MSKQKTLFQSWGDQKSKQADEQPGPSRLNNEEVINLCDSLEDGDDDWLCQADFSTDEPSNQDDVENPTNISIGADGFTPTQGQIQNTSCPGFDMFAGKLWIYPTNYPVRDYQYNIVQQSLYKNTMVTLPTGLGKTFIAAVVMYNFYRWYPQGKVIFMAPTKPLVAQQIEACYNIMGIPQDHTAEMTGSMGPPKREKSWHEKRVFFLTPQVLTNDLSRGSCPAQFVKCLVIDEAHKALGNHAYCQVVRELVKYTEQFRVLALSATPGSDIKAVQQVLSNLLISHIEIRTEESIDIKRYSHERVVDKVVVPLGEELTKVKSKYLQIIDMVVIKLKRHGVLYNKDATSLSKFLILKARDAFRQNPPERLQRSQYGIVEGDFALAMSLYHGYELLQLHGSRSLFNFLEGILTGDKGYGRTRTELSRNGNFNELMDILRQKYTVPQDMTASQIQSKPFVIGHPKMEKLQEIALEHFRKYEAQNATTRVMIFSQYRDSVQEITDMLNLHRPLIKVMSFIGQSSAGKSTKGFTQKEQLKVMKEFREGGYNTLVSTCVGEEGLDIGDVDLIICFDAHKSPIRLVQRMGRTGRKREGRIVMLVTQGKEEQIYNQSQYSKRSIHKAILNGAKSLHFYQHSPRMVPDGLTPSAHKMHITVHDHFKPTKRLMTEGKGEKTAKISSHFNKDKQEASDGLITKEDYEELKPWLVPEEDIPKLPYCDMVSLSTSDMDVEETVVPRGHFLSLSEWSPWQNTLQETSDFMDHSKQSKHLVELMEFIQLQSTFDAGDDPYGLEMAAYLNDDDIWKPGDKGGSADSITRYCVIKPAEDESLDAPVQAKPKGRRKNLKNRHSSLLPEFTEDIVEKAENSDDDDLPTFASMLKTKTELGDRVIEELPDLNEKLDSVIKQASDCDEFLNQENEITKEDEVDGLDFEAGCDIIRKIGKPDSRKDRKADITIQSKAKALDIKMKGDIKTGKRRKIKTVNRSIIELLRNEDDSDFDKTPPNNSRQVHGLATSSHLNIDDNVNGVSSSMKASENINVLCELNKERMYMVKTPPSVEEAVRLCEAAEIEADSVRIDLLDLIEEWHRENENGKYLVYPKTSEKSTPCDATNKVNKKGRKLSEPENDISLNTCSFRNTVMDNITVSSQKCSTKLCEKNTDMNSALKMDQTTMDISKISATTRYVQADTNNDIQLSGSFTVFDENENNTENHVSTEIEVVDEVKETKADENFDSLPFVNDRISVESDANNKHDQINANQEPSACSVESTHSSAKATKTKGRPLEKTKINLFTSSWVSDDSDDELFENIKTHPLPNMKEVKCSTVLQNTSTQVTFTQALNCLHSGSMTSESDSYSDTLPPVKQTEEVNIKDTFSTKVLKHDSDESAKSSIVSLYQVVNIPNASDIFEHQRLKQPSPSTTDSKYDLSKHSDITRKSSTSSEEFEQPKFDLGFDIDEDIIPPSPEMTQPFQGSGKGRLSQSFTVRFSQSKFISNLPGDNNTECTETENSLLKTIPGIKSKRSLRLDDKCGINTINNVLGPLEEEEESQSLLNYDTPPVSGKYSSVLLQHHEDSTSSNNISVLNDKNQSKPFEKPMDTVKKSESSQYEKYEEVIADEDAFETSFALFEDDFDMWIDGDIEEIEKSCSKSNINHVPVKNTQSDQVEKDRPAFFCNEVKPKEIGAKKDDSCMNNKQKKSVIHNRKSVFCPADLSSEDSFSFENDNEKRSDSSINTPFHDKSRDNIPNSTSTPAQIHKQILNKSLSSLVTPVYSKKIDSSASSRSTTILEENASSSDSDKDDSFVIRKRKRKPLCLDSPKSQLNKDSVVDEFSKSKEYKNFDITINKDDKMSRRETTVSDHDDEFDDSFLMKNNNYFGQKKGGIRIQSDSDEDFEINSVIKHHTSSESEDKLQSKVKRKSKSKRPSNPFLEEEAELSDKEDIDASSDETDESHLDKYEGSFIHDSQFSQSQGLNETDIQALYIKSVKSPVSGRGMFKLQYEHKNVDVFSQMPQEEESQYMEDSFCVGSEDDDWLDQDDYHGEITIHNNQSAILQSGKKRRRGVSNLETGRQRALHFGRMKALDEIKTKLAKKNKQIFINKDPKCNSMIIEKRNNDVPKKARIKIQEEYSSDEEINVTSKKRLNAISPELPKINKRKRVRIMSSSDEESHTPKIACTQDGRYTRETLLKISDQHGHQTNAERSNESAVHTSDKTIHAQSKTLSVDTIKSPKRGNKDENSHMASKEFLSRNNQIQRKMIQKEFKGTVEDTNPNSTKKTDVTEKSFEMTKIKDRSLGMGKDSSKSFATTGDDFGLLLHPVKMKSDTTSILVDSKEISGAQDIISDLRFKYKYNVSAAQLPGCDYIISNRMAVERKQWSDFSNGANRAKLIERVQHLVELYDRPCLIIEKDRMKQGDDKSERPVHWTKYIDRTCALLLKSQVKILFTDTQGETASVLADLGQLEKRKSMHISVPVELNPRKTEMVKFYSSFPKLNYVHALNLCDGFESVSEFLKSSINEIQERGKMSTNRATGVFNYIRRDFDTSMLPSKHK